MPICRRKIAPDINYYPTSTGGYVVIESDVAVPYVKEDFERIFEPVPLAKQG